MSLDITLYDKGQLVFEGNITHNLGKMASHSGLYYYLWRPEEINIKYAHQLIHPLTIGLLLLKQNPEKFKWYNPKNDWGNYKGFIKFVRDYLKACINAPNAKIETRK